MSAAMSPEMGAGVGPCNERNEHRNEPGMSAVGMSHRDRGHRGQAAPRPALLFCPGMSE
jgi:hypothetical protein